LYKVELSLSVGKSLVLYVLVAVRLDASSVVMDVFLVSALVIHSLWNSNLEWLVLLHWSRGVCHWA
jgi:RsiW-degrading membrane proteinase PrsW (M82 family)